MCCENGYSPVISKYDKVQKGTGRRSAVAIAIVKDIV